MNGRRRKNRIFTLEQEGEVIEGEKLMDYITGYYKKLFGQADISNINLNIQAPNGISSREQEVLIKPFTMEEIQTMVFSNGEK